MKLPKECEDCQRSECPVHCLHLDKRIQAQGLAEIPSKKETVQKTAGSY